MFGQVRLAVRDWRKMREHLLESIAALKKNPPPVSAGELAESVAFLEWLSNDHFTFLGARDYTYRDEDGGQLVTVEGSGLGVLSDEHAHAIQRGDRHGQLTPEVRAFLKLPQPLIVTKSNQRSFVHRRVHMDYIGVKLFDAKGDFAGEHNFVGLFTSGAYSRRPSDIPLLRQKVEHVREQAATRTQQP